MMELEVNEENLEKFLNNIRRQDKEELLYHFKKNYRKKFKQTVKKSKNTYFVGDKNCNPIAIGGFQECKRRNTFLVWLLCTNELVKNKKELFKYIKTKLEIYKKNCLILFNYIYKSNFQSFNFLKNLGFEILDTKNKDFKLFYYTNVKKGNYFDIRYITC